MIKKLITLFSTLTLLCVSTPAEAGFRTTATYYSNYYNGRRMANGQRFSQEALVAAHPSIKLGTRVKVRHKNRSVVVTIKDRCHCTIDLSRAAFKRLAPLKKGRITVYVSRL